MKTIYTAQEIKKLNNYFKENSHVFNEKEFIAPIVKLLEKSPAMYKGFVNSYHNEKNLQPGYLTEINICATLAKKMSLTYVENAKEMNLRHLYSNADDSVILKQFGSCNMSDIQLISNGKITTIEVKEPNSLGGDYDLKINEEGKLLPAIDKNRIFPVEAQRILDNFNSTDSIFNHLGHNINLEETDSGLLMGVMYSYLKEKNIDFIASYANKTNNLIFFPVSEIDKHVNFKNSEIRISGKNNLKVYTTIAFERALKESGCTIKGETVIIPKTISLSKARGSEEISRIKINPLFFFRIKDVSEDEKFYYANLNKARQNKQGLGIHLNLY